jgi:hypothetical protein
MAYSTIINFTNFWFSLFACGNPAKFPEKMMSGKCNLLTTATKAMLYLQAGTNIFVDLGICIVPLASVAKSNMERNIKISIALIFLLAIS